jgi:hypothetical protein
VRGDEGTYSDRVYIDRHPDDRQASAPGLEVVNRSPSPSGLGGDGASGRKEDQNRTGPSEHPMQGGSALSPVPLSMSIAARNQGNIRQGLPRPQVRHRVGLGMRLRGTPVQEDGLGPQSYGQDHREDVDVKSAGEWIRHLGINWPRTDPLALLLSSFSWLRLSCVDTMAADPAGCRRPVELAARCEPST